MNAAAKIQPWTRPVTFFPRPQSHSIDAVFLPLRFLSDDGYCAIDVYLKNGYNGDVSNGLGISRAAARVMDKCLVTLRGGSATGFSRCRFTSPLQVGAFIVFL